MLDKAISPEGLSWIDRICTGRQRRWKEHRSIIPLLQSPCLGKGPYFHHNSSPIIHKQAVMRFHHQLHRHIQASAKHLLVKETVSKSYNDIHRLGSSVLESSHLRKEKHFLIRPSFFLHENS